MSKFDRILKWLLIIVTVVFVAYTLLWILVTYTTSNKLQKDFAGKKFELAKNASISFSKARAVGFPFKFMIEFIDFREENQQAIITHKDPYRIGYDILSQNFCTEYAGTSEVKYKPLGSGFGAKVKGMYSLKARIPTNMTLLRIVLGRAEPIEMLNYIDHFNIRSRDVHITDSIDGSTIIDDADLDVRLHVKKNKSEYYKTINELVSDIPNDYHLTFKAHTKDAAPNKKPIPFSLIYLTYLPTDFSYDVDLNLHTEATEFSLNDIFKNFTLTTNKMEFFSKINSSKSNIKVIRKEVDEKDISMDIEYESALDLGKDFIDFIEETRAAIVQNVGMNNPAYIVARYLKKLDLSKIKLPDKGIPIDINLKCNVSKKLNDASFKIDKLDIGVEDKKINLTLGANNKFDGEWVSGIINIGNADEVIEYLTQTFIRVNKAPSSPVFFGEKFWVKLYKSFFRSIANGVSEDKKDLILEFVINQDKGKSRLGKNSTGESMLIYYKKLYKQIQTRTSNQSEAIDLFRKIIPSSIDKPEILQEIIGKSVKK